MSTDHRRIAPQPGVGVYEAPMLDVIPQCRDLYQDVQARCVLTTTPGAVRQNTTTLLGKPAPRYFPRSWGPAIPSRIGGC